ncbi:hypothetical protein FRC12_005518 [Ceratobasidium sp. 428]|nr:hypothetical protein FRC12_005518 [Ceratobasidium sp. 428]
MSSAGSTITEELISVVLMELRSLANIGVKGKLKRQQQKVILDCLPTILQHLVHILSTGADVAVYIHALGLEGGTTPVDTGHALMHDLDSADFETAQSLMHDTFLAVNGQWLVRSPEPNLPIFNRSCPFEPFSSDDLIKLGKLDKHLPGLKTLAPLVNKHEVSGPLELKSGYYSLNLTTPWFHQGPPQPILRAQFPNWLHEKLDRQWWNCLHKTYGLDGPVALKQQLEASLFCDPRTGMLLGGPNGVPLAVVAIIKAARWAKTFNIEDECYDRHRDSVFPVDMLKGYLRYSVMDYVQHVNVTLSQIAPSTDARNSRLFMIPDFVDMRTIAQSNAAAPIYSTPPETGALAVSAIAEGVLQLPKLLLLNTAGTSKLLERPSQGTPSKSPSSGSLVLPQPHHSPPRNVKQPGKRSKTDTSAEPTSAQMSVAEQTQDKDDEIVVLSPRMTAMTLLAPSVSETAPTSISPTPKPSSKKRK